MKREQDEFMTTIRAKQVAARELDDWLVELQRKGHQICQILACPAQFSGTNTKQTFDAVMEMNFMVTYMAPLPSPTP
jgi:hypothetical protein